MFAGTSGLVSAIPKRDFPPDYQDKSRLGFYSLHNNSIEINSSFYKVPQAKTVCRWTEEVAPFFRFTFKLWKAITHSPKLIFRAEDVKLFMQAIEGAGDKKGCLLMQFPPGLQVTAFTQLTELIQELKNYSWPLAVEFRHPSWYTDDVYQLLNEHNAALVLQDMPKSAAPFEITSDDFVYLRFHGPSGNYKGSYSESVLLEYASYIQEWQEQGKSVYVYFNNTAGAALENLRFLNGSLL